MPSVVGDKNTLQQLYKQIIALFHTLYNEIEYFRDEYIDLEKEAIRCYEAGDVACLQRVLTRLQLITKDLGITEDAVKKGLPVTEGTQPTSTTKPTTTTTTHKPTTTTTPTSKTASQIQQLYQQFMQKARQLRQKILYYSIIGGLLEFIRNLNVSVNGALREGGVTAVLDGNLTVPLSAPLPRYGITNATGYLYDDIGVNSPLYEAVKIDYESVTYSYVERLRKLIIDSTEFVITVIYEGKKYVFKRVSSYRVNTIWYIDPSSVVTFVYTAPAPKKVIPGKGGGPSYYEVGASGTGFEFRCNELPQVDIRLGLYDVLYYVTEKNEAVGGAGIGIEILNDLSSDITVEIPTMSPIAVPANHYMCKLISDVWVMVLKEALGGGGGGTTPPPHG